jgi:hypothetical protein
MHWSSTGNPLSALNVQPAAAFCTQSKYSGSFEQSVVGEAVGDSVATGEGVETGDSVGEVVGGGQSCSLG